MRGYITFLLFLISFSSFSQILNIERYRLETDSSKNFMAKVTAGVNAYNRSAAAEDPVNLFGYKWDINTMYQKGRHAYVFVSNFDYLKINEDDFLNFGLIHGRAIFDYDKPVNVETYVQYSFDNFRGLEPRWIIGSTFRYEAVNSQRLTLILGVGGLYEKERWFHPNDEDVIRTHFLKSSNYVSMRLSINDFVDLNMVNYYQVGYDREIEAFRNRFNGNLNLNTKITDRFSFTNSFEFSYEDKPIVPITKFIFAFKSGLSFDF